MGLEGGGDMRVLEEREKAGGQVVREKGPGTELRAPRAGVKEGGAVEAGWDKRKGWPSDKWGVAQGGCSR